MLMHVRVRRLAQGGRRARETAHTFLACARRQKTTISGAAAYSGYAGAADAMRTCRDGRFVMCDAARLHARTSGTYCLRRSKRENCSAAGEGARSSACLRTLCGGERASAAERPVETFIVHGGV
jgi:hypothetical protein